jgi:hypothetical protein
MPTVEHSVEIARPTHEIFEHITDVARTPEWISSLVEVRDVAPGPVQTGTTFTEIGRFMAKTLETPKIVTEYQPPLRFVHTSTGGPVPQTFTLSLEPTEAGAILTARLDAEPGSFFGLLPTSVLVTAMKVIMTGDLQRLKESIERAVPKTSVAGG